MKIGIVQMDVVWQDPEANAARLLELVSAAEPAQMLILPELWPVGFTMDKDAHKAHDFSLAVMKSLAREHNCWVLGGIPAPFEPLQQNCAIWIDPNGQEHARYAKRKLFGYGGETGSYSPGDASIVIRAEQLALLRVAFSRAGPICRSEHSTTDLHCQLAQDATFPLATITHRSGH